MTEMSSASVAVSVLHMHYVSPTQLAKLTGRRAEFYRAHWEQIRGNETYASGHRRVPIHCVEEWQKSHESKSCPICSAGREKKNAASG